MSEHTSTLAELMSRDPQGYSEQDLDTLIDYFRKSRHQFNAGNMRAGSTKPKTEKAKASQSIADKLDLGGIDL